MINELGDIGLSGLRKIVDLWRAGTADSLIDYTRPLRVEPLMLVDANVLFLDATPDVSQSLLSMFAGYYLQAFAVSMEVGKISVMKKLDMLNPGRNPGDAGVNAANEWLLSQESYRFRLPSAKNTIAMESEFIRLGFGMEAADPKEPRKTPSKKGESSTLTIGRDSLAALKENTNLSVGKLISVDVTDGLHKATIPVSVRLIANTIPSAQLAHILSMGSEDTSIKARWHDFRAGRKEFVKDLLFCQDLIDAHRKNLMHDKDGLYRNMRARQNKNWLSTIISGNPSVASASNLAIISTDTQAAVELEVNGRLDSYKTRERLFDKTMMMILAVMDQDNGRVTFYFRGIAEKTEVSYRDLKQSARSSGPDVSDILRAYQISHAPSL